jgi:hypothetical protein
VTFGLIEARHRPGRRWNVRMVYCEASAMVAISGGIR